MAIVVFSVSPFVIGQNVSFINKGNIKTYGRIIQTDVEKSLVNWTLKEDWIDNDELSSTDNIEPENFLSNSIFGGIQLNPIANFILGQR